MILKEKNKVSRTQAKFTDEFKTFIIDLFNNKKKTRAQILREYELSPSTFDRWRKKAKQSNRFETKDILTSEQQKLISLRKQMKQLEIDILKQEMLLFLQKRA